MNAYSTDFHSQGPDYPDIKPAASPDAEALSGQWAVLQEAGAVVAALAGIEPDEPLLQIRRFIAWAAECRDWRLDLARNGVADLAAILRSGVTKQESRYGMPGFMCGGGVTRSNLVHLSPQLKMS